MSAPVFQSGQQCSSCGESSPLMNARITCANCGGLLDVVHTPVRDVGGAGLRALFDERARHRSDEAAWQTSGVWRFREIVLPAADAEVVSYPEGNTPLLVREAISDWSGVESLRIKHEGMNPSGSFKDRGMSVALTQAKRLGVAAVACASTGNTASSLAAYAGIAGIGALVLVPAGLVSAGKLAQTIAYGARVLLVRGDFDDCLRLVRESAEKLGVYLVNSVNPFRIEGQKTIIWEMLQQLGWNSPDWIALPAGNLGNAAAFGKALREAREWGLIEKSPRLLLVQASGAAPFAQSFSDGFRTRRTVHADTIATAIRIGNPASYDRAVRAVLETGGHVTDVSDEEIMEAKRVVDSCGTGCEPASAASVAGVRRMVRQGVVKRSESVVAVLTGHVLKDASGAADGTTNARAQMRGSSSGPVEVEPTLEAVERAITRS